MRTAVPADYPRLRIKGPALGALAISALVFGGGLGSAAVLQIDRGVSLGGTFIVETKAKAIQHQRGGTVSRLHVVEGQQVSAGQLLVTFDTQALDEQITALKSQAESSRQQFELLREELATIAQLAERKLATRSRVLAVERQFVEVQKENTGLQGRIALAEQELSRAVIRAPVAGRVLSLAVFGPGAVVQPGATVLEVVPQDDRLVIEARLAPMLLEKIKTDMEAKVWLTGLSWRDQRPLQAKLAWVSPDVVEDRRSGAAHFIARVELIQTRSELSKSMTLHPGMRAEILLLTGKRTVLEQLLDPIVRNLHRAFRT